MNTRQRAMYLLVQHTAYLNDIFYPQRNPLVNPNVSDEQLNVEPALNKLQSLRTDKDIVENVVDRETMLQVLKAHYDYYMRDQFTVRFYGKNQNTFTYGMALLHKDLKCKAPLIEPNLRRNLGKWST